jgi:glyoxylase-like metal-dependent hydrolase (beta-lactamase superfamily II)
VGGNEALGKKGSTIAGGNVVGDIGGSASQGATIIAHEEVLNRMSAPPAAGQPAASFGALPTDTYVGAEKDLFFNGEGIQLLHQPAAHTDGDTIVFFRRSDVVSTGDIFTPERYPIIDLDRGGSVQGLIDGLNLIIDLTIPAEKQEGGTLVIPGHGRLCDEADVVEYRDMLTIVRDRFQDMIGKGMTLEQVKAAKPTEDYDPLYGNNTRFVEAVYRSLKK